MTSGSGAIPRIYYDDLDDSDTRLNPDVLAGLQGNVSYRGGTALMPAAVAPVLQGPAARFVAAHTPHRVQIRVTPEARKRTDPKPTVVEWAVAVGAGLVAAIGIGVVAALI
jgi:hypothetical protein